MTLTLTVTLLWNADTGPREPGASWARDLVGGYRRRQLKVRDLMLKYNGQRESIHGWHMGIHGARGSASLYKGVYKGEGV